MVDIKLLQADNWWIRVLEKPMPFDVQMLATAIGGAKSLYDLIDALLKRAKSATAHDLPPEVASSLLGEASKAQGASAKLSQMLTVPVRPFILRMGSSFRLPGDISKMEQAIRSTVWDWTYVFGYDRKKTPGETVDYIKRLYLDPEDPRKARPDSDTTCLYLFEEDLPREEFGLAVYIAGVALTSSSYAQVFDIQKDDLLPRVVIVVDKDIRAVTDPIVMNFILIKAIDYLFEVFSHQLNNTGVLFDKKPTDKERCLDHDLLAKLGVHD
jgi:hypothetical protein